MQLVAQRRGHCTNGVPYDSKQIAQKAFRLATCSLFREAETVSEHEKRRGAVRLLDAPDHGYVLAVRDDAEDVEEAHLSIDLDEVLAAYTSWARALG